MVEGCKKKMYTQNLRRIHENQRLAQIPSTEPPGQNRNIKLISAEPSGRREQKVRRAIRVILWIRIDLRDRRRHRPLAVQEHDGGRRHLAWVRAHRKGHFGSWGHAFPCHDVESV